MESLSVWSLRRVLLAGSSGPMISAMESLLRAVGARPVCISPPYDEEMLSRTLHAGRFSCVIALDFPAPGEMRASIAALDVLLGEAREAGVPLAILLCPSSAPDAAPLISHAKGWAQGAFGDPVNVQCIRHTGENTQAICREALMLGARFLAGERGCTGVFSSADGKSPLGLAPQSPTRDFIPKSSHSRASAPCDS